MVFDNNKGGEYGKYIVQELQEPANMMDPEFRKIYESFAKRILWIDNNVCPGAFQMNTAWYKAPPERDPIFTEHVHGYSELIGFYGSDPENPYELNGVIEFTLGGEAHRLTRSSLMFIPSNVPHNPMRILEVNKPIFHFSVVMNLEYAEGKSVYK